MQTSMELGLVVAAGPVAEIDDAGGFFVVGTGYTLLMVFHNFG